MAFDVPNLFSGRCKQPLSRYYMQDLCQFKKPGFPPRGMKRPTGAARGLPRLG